MPSSPSLIALALALAAAPAVADAQAVVQPLPARTDADRLADTMRQLAVSPQDVNALATAGELSLKLDDLTAAAGFFARADKVDPRSPRVKAGEGALMVRNERPGEALRYFAQAESYGGTTGNFAADRGLAYDLVGDQPRAQQQYRLALKAQPQDDETVRRYALSLGIAGRRDQALAELEPLLRKTDRAAWRSRAFILAMNGDQAGAEHIATTMMPPGMAQGLLPFFQRLPNLPVVDRAFAVHFGEVRASADRIADARMAPAAAPLAIEPAPVQIAAQTVQPDARPAKKERRSRRDRDVAPVVMPVVTAQALPPPPAYGARPVVPRAATTMAPPQPIVQRLPQTAASMAQPYRAPAAPGVARTQPVAPVVAVRPTPPAVVLASQPPIPVATVPVRALAPAVVETRTTPPSEPIAPIVLAAPARPPARPTENAILARIIAGLSIPAAELDAAPPPRAAPVEVAANERADRLAEQAAAEKVAADRAAESRKAALEKKAADRKAAADKKALAAKKAAADAKALADKEAAEERKAARANPERIWVQVAGGANEDDLPKAWKATRAKAPDVFGSRGGWSTPLRATNRVLAGPFKTSDEARAFVNDLKKKGVSAFTFTSEAGQPVAKLPK